MGFSAVPTDREQFVRWLRVELPRLLREDPAFYAEVVGILVQAIGSRTDVERLLQESKALREQAERSLEAAERRFEATERHFAELLERLRVNDSRFELMERRFEEVFQRFEAVDRRFEEVFQRFEATDRRFEEVFQRLEAVDRRFEAVDRRFEEVFQRFEATDRRFEEIFRRFEAMDRRFEANERRLSRIELGFDSLGIQVGRGLESVIPDVIADFSGIEHLEARKLVLTDAAGEVFEEGGEVEIDAYVHNGRRFLVEVKSYAKPGDASAFAKKARFAERELGITAEKVLIALAAAPGTRERADRLDIRLITFGSS